MKTGPYISVYITGNVYALYNRITKRYTIVYPEADIAMASMVPIKVIEGKTPHEKSVETLSKYPKSHLEKVSAVKKFGNLHEFHCYMLKTVLGWSYKMFQTVFNTDIMGYADQHERAKIFYQKGYSKAKRTEVRDIVSRSFEKYDKVGIHFDDSQIINIGRCTNDISQGSYMFHGEITINPFTLDTNCMERVLVHELGHRQYYTKFDSVAKNAIGKKFFDLVPETIKIKDYIRELSHRVQLGEILLNDGGGNGISRGKFTGKWYVTYIDHISGEITLACPEKDESAKGTVNAFLESGFIFECDNYRFQNIVPHGTFSMGNDTKINDWFPSLYSMTNEIEWHAENMTLVVFNQLNGEPLDFFTSLIYK